MKSLDALILTVTIGLLASTVAHATRDFCRVAGTYQGEYLGTDDHGPVAAVVALHNGTVRGAALSASGRTITFKGTVSETGDFSSTASGDAATDARLDGKFSDSDRGAHGEGQWTLSATAESGTGDVVRTRIP